MVVRFIIAHVFQMNKGKTIFVNVKGTFLESSATPVGGMFPLKYYNHTEDRRKMEIVPRFV